MGIFDRIGNGWRLAMASIGVIRENRNLALFPVLSGIALILVLAFFAGGIFLQRGFTIGRFSEMNETARYLLLFCFFFVTYAVMIFFNMALVHCAMKRFDGGEPSVGDGISFGFSRLGVVLSWAFLSATVGLILRIIEDKNERIAQFVAGILGMLWSVLTFLVVPVLAYENISIFDAVKRSSELLKNTWGERIGANFAFGLINFLLLLFVALPVGILIGLINPLAGVAAGLVVVLVVLRVMSAAQTVFQAAAYRYAIGSPVPGFGADVMGSLFAQK